MATRDNDPDTLDLEDRYGLSPRAIDALPVQGLTDEELRRTRREIDAAITAQEDTIVDALNKVPEADRNVTFDGEDYAEE